jgi:hypothetical protein
MPRSGARDAPDASSVEADLLRALAASKISSEEALLALREEVASLSRALSDADAFGASQSEIILDLQRQNQDQMQ